MTNIRIGLGTDLHRLEAGNRLVIGSVVIPHTKGCVGHSDGDALIHAICDTLLGAANMRDIGYHFPDTSVANKNRESRFFLTAVMEMLREKSYEIVNIDCSIHLQKPKLRDYIPQMQRNLASIMQISEDRISIKAKTGEKVGPVGEEQAIEVQCVALIEKQ